jgi:hypothetical protein
LTAALAAKKLHVPKQSFDDDNETVKHVYARAVAAAMRRTADGGGGCEHRQIHCLLGRQVNEPEVDCP